jgi:hypothetical protein
MSDTSPYTLRDLPLPAKLVVSVFLLAVGLGYFTALIQMHLKHASPGEAMPTISDVVARFSGAPWPLVPKPEKKPDDRPMNEEGNKQVKAEGNAPGQIVTGVKIKSLFNDRCVVCHHPESKSDANEYPLTDFDTVTRKYLTPKNKDGLKNLGKMHDMISAKRRDRITSSTMVIAFFDESTDYEAEVAKRSRETVNKEREAERLAMIAWIEAGALKEAFEKDAFPLPDDPKYKALTLKYRTAALAKEVQPPKKEEVPEDPNAKAWQEARKRRVSLDALTQSTHAHLLSFSMLWGLTGLIFAFTSYPKIFRFTLAPIVLIAQVADIACWWLARLDGIGPYFAISIIGTGGIVGLGLALQIVLSLFNMYGSFGKTVLVALFLGAGATGYVVYDKVLVPELAAEKQEAGREK